RGGCCSKSDDTLLALPIAGPVTVRARGAEDHSHSGMRRAEVPTVGRGGRHDPAILPLSDYTDYGSHDATSGSHRPGRSLIGRPTRLLLPARRSTPFVMGAGLRRGSRTT